MKCWLLARSAFTQFRKFVAIGAIALATSTGAIAEEVTFLATGVVTGFDDVNEQGGTPEENPPFEPDYLGAIHSGVVVGDPWRAYFTFDSDTPESTQGASREYHGAIKSIRFVIGDDEFSFDQLDEGTITTNFNEVPYYDTAHYYTYYRFGAKISRPNGYVECSLSLGVITDQPITGLQMDGLSAEPPHLENYSSAAGQSLRCDFQWFSFPGREDAYAAYAWIFGISVPVERVGGPVNSDIDGDQVYDIEDICPADPTNECDASQSGAMIVSAANGGTVLTPDAGVSLVVDAGEIDSDATLSVTSDDGFTDRADLALSGGPALGEVLAAYDLEPDGLQFNSPITLSVRTDVTALTTEQRSNVDIYLFADLDGDGVNESFEPLGAACSVVEEQASRFVATCIVELEHFSEYAVVAARDADGDGVFDLFEGQHDSCPTEDARGFDADNNGCIDTIGGLAELVHKLVVEGVIDAEFEDNLMAKIEKANTKASKDKICPAISKLEALKQRVAAKTGKKISAEAAAKVINYTSTVIAGLRARLPSGSTCT